MQEAKKQFLQQLSVNIRKNRKVSGLTQEQVASRAKINVVTFQKYESKNSYNMTIYNLMKIARVLDVSLNDLVN